MPNFKSPGAAAASALQQALFQQEAARRQQMLDGIVVESQARQRAQQEEAARRQAVLDQRVEADRLATLRGSGDLLGAGEADVLTQGGYRVNDVSTLPSRTAVGDLASGTMATSAAAPTVYGQQRMETPGEILARQARERKIAAEAADEAFRNKLKPAQKHLVTVAGPNGQPIQRLVTEDELAAGIPIYEKPDKPSGERAKRVWVERNGQPVFVTEDQITFGDRPFKGDGGSGNTTEGQRRTAGLLDRALAARGVVDAMESDAGGWNAVAPATWMQTPHGQQYGQAAKQWIQSVLRDESGAAIGADEEASYFKTYFRQPWDSAAVIEQKQQARNAAESAMAQKAGRTTTGNTRGPAPGTRGVVNGIPAVWDGRGWLPAGGR